MAVLGVSTTSCLSGTGGEGRGRAIVVCQPREEKVKRVASSIIFFFFTRSLREWKCFPSERYFLFIFFSASRETNQAKREALQRPAGSRGERERKDESADGSELFTLEFKFSGMRENTVWRIYRPPPRPQRAGRAEAHWCFLREARTASISVCLVISFTVALMRGGEDVKLHTASKKSITGLKKKNLDLCKSDFGKSHRNRRKSHRRRSRAFSLGSNPTKLF